MSVQIRPERSLVFDTVEEVLAWPGIPVKIRPECTLTFDGPEAAARWLCAMKRVPASGAARR